jgi:hypothetical protein
LRQGVLCIALSFALVACGRLAAVPTAPDRCLVTSLPDEDWARSLPDSLRLTSRPSRLDPVHAREIAPMEADSQSEWVSVTAFWSEGPGDSLNLQFIDIDSSWLLTLVRDDTLLHGRIRWSFMHGGSTQQTGNVTARWVSCQSGA